MSSMYQEEILERYRHPRNFGKMENPDAHHKEFNALCGDVVEVQLKINNEGRVSDAKFIGHGCVISQSSSDLLMESIKGKEITEIKKLDKHFILKLLGIEISHVRLKCALLPLLALQIAASKK